MYRPKVGKEGVGLVTTKRGRRKDIIQRTSNNEENVKGMLRTESKKRRPLAAKLGGDSNIDTRKILGRERTMPCCPIFRKGGKFYSEQVRLGIEAGVELLE